MPKLCGLPLPKVAADTADLKWKEYFDEIIPFETDEKPAHKYEVKITKAVFDDDCFEVWKGYEFNIHKKKEKQKSGYERFLCQSPLYDPKSELDCVLPHFERDLDELREVKDEGLFPASFGSYHMIHKIDGKVFMVGVIDLTDTCLSSVYLYYDTKYEFLSPGTLSALREIEFVKQAVKKGLAPASFKYYYMGLYYQTC